MEKINLLKEEIKNVKEAKEVLLEIKQSLSMSFDNPDRSIIVSDDIKKYRLLEFILKTLDR